MKSMKSIHIEDIYDDSNLQQNEAMNVLKSCKSLQEVTIRNCWYVEDLLVQSMKSNSRIQRLKIQNSSRMSIKLFENFEMWQGLKTLELIDLDIKEDVLLEFAKIKSLKSLKMQKCRYILLPVCK